MNGTNSEEYKSLIARLDDGLAKAERGEVALTHFLDPKECRWAEGHLKRIGRAYAIFGGYADAERKRAYIFPDYVEMQEGVEQTLEEYGYFCGISLLTVKGSCPLRMARLIWSLTDTGTSILQNCGGC